MPLGAERAWASRVLGLGAVLSQVCASALTPLLSERLGWKTTVRLYGVLSADIPASVLIIISLAGAVVATISVLWYTAAASRPQSIPCYMIISASQSKPWP